MFPLVLALLLGCVPQPGVGSVTYSRGGLQHVLDLDVPRPHRRPRKAANAAAARLCRRDTYRVGPVFGHRQIGEADDLDHGPPLRQAHPVFSETEYYML